MARVPGWFTVAQARRVAELKRVSARAGRGPRSGAGAVSAAVLAQAPATDMVARWTNRTDAHVSPDAAVATAEQLLRAQGASCLPVVTAGGLLVGTISRPRHRPGQRRR